MTEPTMDDLYNQYTSDEQVQAATTRPTKVVAPGRYALTDLRRLDAKVTPDNWSVPGRPYVDGFATFTNTITGEQNTIGFDASWIEHKRADSKGVMRQDAMSQLWGQLVKATDTVGKSVGTTLDQIRAYPTAVEAHLGVIVTRETGKEYIRDAKTYAQVSTVPGFAELEKKNFVAAFVPAGAGK